MNTLRHTLYQYRVASASLTKQSRPCSVPDTSSTWSPSSTCTSTSCPASCSHSPPRSTGTRSWGMLMPRASSRRLPCPHSASPTEIPGGDHRVVANLFLHSSRVSLTYPSSPGPSAAPQVWSRSISTRSNRKTQQILSSFSLPWGNMHNHTREEVVL